MRKKPGAIFGSGERQRLSVSLVSFIDSNPNGQTDTDFVWTQARNGVCAPCKNGIEDYYADFSRALVQMLGSYTSGLL